MHAPLMKILQLMYTDLTFNFVPTIVGGLGTNLKNLIESIKTIKELFML